MMQIRSTIQKLLRLYTTDALLYHVASEIEQDASHFQTIGAPLKAARMLREAEILRSAAKQLSEVK